MLSIPLARLLSCGVPLMFAERVERAQRAADSLVCVGLDPDLAKIPADLRDDAEAFLAFGRRVIDATHDLAAAYKPQIAFYSALGKERELEATIGYIRARPRHSSSSTRSAATSATPPRLTRARRSIATARMRSR